MIKSLSKRGGVMCRWVCTGVYNIPICDIPVSYIPEFTIFNISLYASGKKCKWKMWTNVQVGLYWSFQYTYIWFAYMIYIYDFPIYLYMIPICGLQYLALPENIIKQD